METTTLVHLLSTAQFSQAVIKIDIGEVLVDNVSTATVDVYSCLRAGSIDTVIDSPFTPPSAENVMTSL